MKLNPENVSLRSVNLDHNGFGRIEAFYKRGENDYIGGSIRVIGGELDFNSLNKGQFGNDEELMNAFKGLVINNFSKIARSTTSNNMLHRRANKSLIDRDRKYYIDEVSNITGNEIDGFNDTAKAFLSVLWAGFEMAKIPLRNRHEHQPYADFFREAATKEEVLEAVPVIEKNLDLIPLSRYSNIIDVEWSEELLLDYQRSLLHGPNPSFLEPTGLFLSPRGAFLTLPEEKQAQIIGLLKETGRVETLSNDSTLLKADNIVQHLNGLYEDERLKQFFGLLMDLEGRNKNELGEFEDVLNFIEEEKGANDVFQTLLIAFDQGKEELSLHDGFHLLSERSKAHTTIDKATDNIMEVSSKMSEILGKGFGKDKAILKR